MSTIEQPKTFLAPIPLEIPPISDELIKQLSERIKPLVEHEGVLFYIEEVDPRDIAFTYSPTRTNQANSLEPVVSMPTLHVYGAPAFFKPSVAEVLAQIPAGYTDQVVAFQTAPNQESIDYWPQADSTALSWGFHLATTTLYKPA